MNLPILSQMPEQLATALLLVLLIAAFIIAFKIMKMVMQTVLVSVLSAGFYVSLVFLFDYSFSFNSLLFFSFLGSGLYMGYTFLASAYKLVERIIVIPYKLVLLGLIPFKIAYRELKDHWETEELKKKIGSRETSKDDNGSYTTKEVVLDKVKEDDDDTNRRN